MAEGRALLRARQFFEPRQRSEDGWNERSTYSRDWEAAYRRRWQHDRVVRSTHGVNCTGSCSWKIHVKDGLVTWETQQTDYPSNGPRRPDYEPRGCPRGASFSWYIYSPLRPKYPYVRGVLLEMFREARERLGDPVEAWASIVEDPEKARAYKSQRGKGGFLRADWDEVTELIAAAHVHTIRKLRPRPDRRLLADPGDVDGLLLRRDPLPLADRRRLPLLLRLVRRPAAGLAADLGRPDRRARVGGLVERLLPDALGLQHPADADAGRPLHDRGALPRPEGRRRSRPTTPATPSSPTTGCPPRAGTDGALAMAMGHVILKEFFLERQVAYFAGLRAAASPTCPSSSASRSTATAPTRGGAFLRASDLGERVGERRVADGRPRRPQRRAAGPQRHDRRPLGRGGEGALEPRPGGDRAGADRCSIVPRRRSRSTLPRFDGGETEGGTTMRRGVPAVRVGGALVTTVFDLAMAQYGVARDGPAGRVAERLRRRLQPHTPAWQEVMTGVDAGRCARIAREFATNAEQTDGRSMIVMGAGTNHWFHSDQTYRAMLSLVSSAAARGSTAAAGPTTSARRRCGRSPAGTRRLRPRLAAAGAPAAGDAVLVPGHRPVALRDLRRRGVRLAGRDPARCAGEAHRRLPRAGGAARLAALLSELQPQPARPRRRGRARPGASRPSTSSRELRDGPPRVGLRGPRRPGQLPPRPDALAGQPARLLEQGPRVLPAPPARRPRRRRALRRVGAGEAPATRSAGASEAPRGEARPLHDDRLPHERLLRSTPTSSCRRRPGTRSTTSPRPTCTPSSTRSTRRSRRRGRRRPTGTRSTGSPPASPSWPPKHLGTRTDIVAAPLLHDTPDELAQPGGRVRDWRAGECEPVPGRTMPQLVAVERDYAAVAREDDRARPAGRGAGDRGRRGSPGSRTREVEELAELQRHGARGRRRRPAAAGARRRGLRDDPRPLRHHQRAPRGGELPRAGVSAPGARSPTSPPSTPTERLTFARPRAPAAQGDGLGRVVGAGVPRAAATRPSPPTSSARSPGGTLTGRQQLYLDHEWMLDLGEGLPAYRPPVDAGQLLGLGGEPARRGRRWRSRCAT